MKSLMNENLYHELKRVGESAVIAERITGGFTKNFNDLFERSKVRKGDVAVASNIGKLLNTPNCPFVLFVLTKKLVKRREFESFISNKVEI